MQGLPLLLPDAFIHEAGLLALESNGYSGTLTL